MLRPAVNENHAGSTRQRTRNRSQLTLALTHIRKVGTFRGGECELGTVFAIAAAVLAESSCTVDELGQAYISRILPRGPQVTDTQ